MPLKASDNSNNQLPSITHDKYMLKEKMSLIQCRDTALAFAFLGLLIWFFTDEINFVYATMFILLWVMVWPSSWQWPARFWFGFSHVLGFFMSKVLLSLIYFIILMPVAIVRRFMGKDSMRLKTWSNPNAENVKQSAFVVREHKFTPKDLEHPY